MTNEINGGYLRHRATEQQWDRLYAAEHNQVDIRKYILELLCRIEGLENHVNRWLDSSIERDAARYRWLKSKANLELRTERTYGPPWTNVETQEKYHPFGYLAVNGTGFTGIKNMDDAIDQAMEMYP